MKSWTRPSAAIMLGLAGLLSLSAPPLQGQISGPPLAALVPATAAGSYELTFHANVANAPFADGASAILSLTPTGRFCLNDRVLRDPEALAGFNATAVWQDRDDELAFAVPSFGFGFIEITVAGLNGSPIFGEFRGNQVSADTTCPGADGGDGDELENALGRDERDILRLAEALYPALFPGAGELGREQGFVYRHYPDSGVYAGFREGRVFLMGAEFGTTPSDIGSVAEILAMLRELERTSFIGNQVGPYRLEVSGSRSVSHGGATTPPSRFSLDFFNVSAPDPRNEAEVALAIERALRDLIDLVVTEVVVSNTTPERVTFSVIFEGRQKGIRVNYEATWDYRLN